MLSENFYEELKKKILPYFEDANPDHDFMHVERVMNIAMKIGEKEGADLEILKISVLLHDVARKEEDDCCGEICHAEKGAKIAKEILEEMNFSEEKIEKVVHCIYSHRARKEMNSKIIEAKVLFDADKIDGMGAIGIGRLFSFAGRIGAVVHNPNVSIENTQSYTKEDSAYRDFLVKQDVINRMKTKTGKKIANERWKYMEEFFNRLNKEVKGEI